MKKALAFVFLASFAIAQEAGTFVKIGDVTYLQQISYAAVKTKHIKNILYPVLGCPTVLEWGKPATIIVKLPAGSAASAIMLYVAASADKYSRIYKLPVQSVAYDSQYSAHKVTVSVPEIPEDVYNLKLLVPSLGIMDTQFCSVLVRKTIPESFRFAVIADTHFSDPRGFIKPSQKCPGSYNAFTITKQVIKELRSQQIDFVLLCGDICFGTSYDFEYEGAWNQWKESGLAIFMVPGNHDSYSSIKKRTVLGITCPKRDGLDFYRANFGPAFYSFDYGGFHFLGVNSADGTAARRDGFYVVVANYGGDLSTEQMQFIASDTQNVTKNLIPFSHHSVIGPFKPNETFSPWGYVFGHIIEFVVNGYSIDGFKQEWNDISTAYFLRAKIDGKCPIYFSGHDHQDDSFSAKGTEYRKVTTAGSEARQGAYWGYTLVTVKDGAITDSAYMQEDILSYPTGNLVIEEDGGTKTVANYLMKSRKLELEFFVPKSAAGYEITPDASLKSVEDMKNGFVKVTIVAEIGPAQVEFKTPQTAMFKVSPK